MLWSIVISTLALAGMILFGLGLARAIDLNHRWLVLLCGTLLILSFFALASGIVEVFARHSAP